MRSTHRYRHSEGKKLIEVRIKSPLQLFDSRDPAPFRDRDLDDDFVEYILTSAKEFSLTTPLKILIHVEEPATKELSEESIKEAISSFLVYQIDLQSRELRNFMKRAQMFLFLGLIVLAVCIGLAQSLVVPEPPGLIGILREGIVIFGWVSIWKPIELILFDWYPHYEKMSFFKKLLKTQIQVQYSDHS